MNRPTKFAFAIALTATIVSFLGRPSVVLAHHSTAEYDATSLLLTALVSKGDLDFDGRLTLRDVAAFQRCFQGAGYAPPIVCTLPVNSDFDGDGDVDLDDFATVYPAEFTGP